MTSLLSKVPLLGAGSPKRKARTSRATSSSSSLTLSMEKKVSSISEPDSRALTLKSPPIALMSTTARVSMIAWRCKMLTLSMTWGRSRQKAAVAESKVASVTLMTRSRCLMVKTVPLESMWPFQQEIKSLHAAGCCSKAP